MYATEMKMPSNYSDLSADEMEYDGGWLFTAIVVGLICEAISIGCNHVYKKTGNKGWAWASHIFGWPSAALGFMTGGNFFLPTYSNKTTSC